MVVILVYIINLIFIKKIYQQRHKKLLETQTKFNQEVIDLNNECDQLTAINIELKNKLEQVFGEYTGFAENYHIMKEKHTKQLKVNEELRNEIFDLNNEVKELTATIIGMKNKLER
eukprot:394014_1